MKNRPFRMFKGSLGLFRLFVQNKILFLKARGLAVDKKQTDERLFGG